MFGIQVSANDEGPRLGYLSWFRGREEQEAMRSEKPEESKDGLGQ